MKKLLSFLRALVSDRRTRAKALTLLVVLISAPARADCVLVSKATVDSTCVVMRLGNQQGIWFTLSVAEEFRKLRLEAPELRLQVHRLESSLQLESESSAFFRRAAEERRLALVDSEHNVDIALAHAVKIEEESRAWYRSPWLWFSAGVLVSGAVSIGVMSALE